MEASLKDRPGLDVVRIDTTLPNAGQRLHALCPDVVILDLAAPYSKFAIPLLRRNPGLPLIGLDVNSNTLILLSSRRYTALTTNDLTQVIQTQICPQGQGN